MVEKVKQQIADWFRHPSVAIVIGCLKIGEGIRTSLDAVEFLGTTMTIQTGIYLAMAITVAYAMVVAVLAIRSRRREDRGRRRRFRRPGPYSGKEVITSKRG